MSQLFCAWLPHSDVKAIVTRFVAAVAAGLCRSGRIVPELVNATVAHFMNEPIRWLAVAPKA
jgi:hypothetical protein